MNNGETPRIPSRLLTPSYLADEAWHFANALTMGRWSHEVVQKVTSERSIVEMLGSEYELPGKDVKPIIDELAISFSALKRLADFHGTDKLVPMYKITSTGYQTIDANEIPPAILEEIIEEAQEEDSMVHGLLEDADITDFSAISVTEFEEFDIQQIHETSYTIDHEGDIEEYSFEHSYSIEDSKVYTLDWSSSDKNFLWSPVMLADGTMKEKKPIVLPLLNKFNLEGDVRELDASIETFMNEHDLSQLDELSSLSKEEHIGRILAMLSMVSSGVVDLRRR